MRNAPSAGVTAGKRGFPARDGYRGIKLVVFDVDGVMTDGRIILDANGIESKFFDVRDGTGVTILHKAGLKTALITGRSSVVVDHRAKELKVAPEFVRQGVKLKLPVFNEMLAAAGITAQEAAYVGDDLIDLPVLQAAGLACCPSDSHDDIIPLCHVVAQGRGGRGAVRQICEHILQFREDGSWENAVAAYLGRTDPKQAGEKA
jgi:3-deoxy-D-manno-octulosonate 8-phosphate phosphatase (KDO 8-P phosphatase)